MSYANDWTYIYTYNTKLIKKQKQTFEIEKQPIIFFSNVNSYFPLIIIDHISKYGLLHFSPVICIKIEERGISSQKMNISKK